MIYQIHDLQALSMKQRELVKTTAQETIKKRIGDKPTIDKYKREYASVFTVIDVFLLIVFLSAWIISSIKINDHVAKMMIDAVSTPVGFSLAYDTKVKIIQLCMIMLSEFAMLAFMVMWQTERKQGKTSDLYNPVLRFVDSNKFLVLALLSMTFVVSANWNTATDKLIAIIPPASTILIGFRIETIVSELIQRKRDIEQRYETGLYQWELYMSDVTRHPDYQPVLRSATWEKLISLKANRQFEEAPIAFKRLAVYKQLEHDNWTKDDTAYTEMIQNAQEQPKTTPKTMSKSKTSNTTQPDRARQWLLDNTDKWQTDDPDKPHLPYRTIADMIADETNATMNKDAVGKAVREFYEVT